MNLRICVGKLHDNLSLPRGPLRGAIALAGVALLVGICTSAQEVQKPSSPVFREAKTAECIAEVEGPRPDKASFKAETERILRVVDGTKLWTRYREVRSSKADIIIKISEDRSLVDFQTISLKVFSPDDNKQIYGETRDLVDMANDVTRLVAHFLAAVEEQRSQNERAQKESERQAKLRGEILSMITCPFATMYANRGSERTVKTVLHRGDLVVVMTDADSEFVVKVGSDVGYVDSQCVEK